MNKPKSISQYAPTNQKHRQEISIVQKIGSGLTAKVYEVNHPVYGKSSLKIIDKNFIKSKVGAKLIKNEIQILRKISHENVLKMHESFTKDGSMMILTNYCEGGDLEKKIYQAKYLSVSYSLRIFQGLIKALKYLFKKNILHRDIKPANIFLHNNCPILADFGFAILHENSQMMKLNVGSPLYMAPQCLASKQFSEKSDIFALGVVFFEMLTGKTPWTASSQRDLQNKMLKESPSLLLLKFSDEIKKIILSCLSPNRDQRPTVEVLEVMVEEIIKKEKMCMNEKENSIFHKFQSKTSQKQEKPLLQLRMNTKPNENVINREKKITSHYLKPLNIDSRSKSKENHQINRSITFYQVAKNINSKTSGLGNKKNQENTLKIKKSEKSKKEEMNLKQIKPQVFTFLPGSLIAKFKFILEKYGRIQKGENFTVSLSEQEQKDMQIQEINSCQTEEELCKRIQGFIRRLYRLAKSYKGYNKELQGLSKLYERVTDFTS